MKLSACHRLLPPLLLLFGCHCLADARGKVDADNQHSIYNTNPLINDMRSDLKVNEERSKDRFPAAISSKTDFPCPESATIAPCTCSLDPDNRIYFDCTSVESVDQLREAFIDDFPVKDLYQFKMTHNSAIHVFPSFMNGVTFESVYLFPGPFTLEGISEYFLFDLKDTLKEFAIYDSKLSTDFFPFIMLPSMNQLESLHIDTSDIKWLPQIQAPNLTRFILENSPYDLLANGTFPIGAGPMTIDLYKNHIHTVEVGSFFFADQNSAASNELITIDLKYNKLQSLGAGTFPLRNGPTVIYLSNNLLSSIEPGTFVLPASTGAASTEQISINLSDNKLESLTAGTFPLVNGPTTISLSSNLLSSIEPGTFVLPASTDLLGLDLNLSFNKLTNVDEAVFGSLMPFITLDLYDNPLTCSCDIAWLIGNEDFMANVELFATCADGTNLHDLDPHQFMDFC